MSKPAWSRTTWSAGTPWSTSQSSIAVGSSCWAVPLSPLTSRTSTAPALVQLARGVEAAGQVHRRRAVRLQTGAEDEGDRGRGRRRRRGPSTGRRPGPRGPGPATRASRTPPTIQVTRAAGAHGRSVGGRTSVWRLFGGSEREARAQPSVVSQSRTASATAGALVGRCGPGRKTVVTGPGIAARWWVSSSGEPNGSVEPETARTGHVDVRQVRDAQGVGPARRVQRVGEQDEPGHGQTLRDGHRAHAPAERAAAEHQVLGADAQRRRERLGLRADLRDRRRRGLRQVEPQHRAAARRPSRRRPAAHRRGSRRSRG